MYVHARSYTWMHVDARGCTRMHADARTYLFAALKGSDFLLENLKNENPGRLHAARPGCTWMHAEARRGTRMHVAARAHAHTVNQIKD